MAWHRSKARGKARGLGVGASLWLVWAPAVLAAGPGSAGEGPRPPPPPSIDHPAVWDGLVGQRVVISLPDDRVLRGTMLGRRDGQLVVARASDGALVSVAPSEAKSVALDVGPRRRPMLRPKNNGAGLIVGGAIMLGLGLPLAVSGGVLMWIIPELNLAMNMHLLATGTGMTAGGAATLAVGIERRRYWRAYELERGMYARGGFGGQAPQVPWSYTLRF